MTNKLVLSSLAHTWILDLDGTIVRHNGYKIDGVDTFLPGAKEFLSSIPEKDMIIFITAREAKYKLETENFLQSNNVRYNYIIFDAPHGERILINDSKLSGLKMSYGINVKRDQSLNIVFVEDSDL